MALIVVLSVMGGFEADFREKIIGSKAHVVVSAEEGYLENYQEIREIIRQTPHVEGVNVYAEAEVMLNSPTNLQAAILRGIDYHEITTTTKLGEYMEEGKLEYLENPDALPSIQTAMSIQRGSLTIQSDPEDGELTEERAEKLEKAGARAAIAFAGNKHGQWMKDGTNAPEGESAAAGTDPKEELYDLPDLKEDLESLEQRENVKKTEAVEEQSPEDAELAALIGEDRWVDSESTPHRNNMPAIGEETFERYPNAELLPVKTRSRQMKTLPGLSADDVNVRRVGAIILGRELKTNLTLYQGAELNVMSPSGDVGPTGGLPKSRPFKVVGSYYSGMFDFDAKMAYISLADAQALLGIGDSISGIDVRCTRLEDSLRVRDELRAKLSGYKNVRVDDWRTLNASLFGAIMLEKVAMFVILTSIILVASFNILCLLIMMVIEKAREIAIFKAMGTTDRSIVQMFVVQGAVIGGLGTAIGLVLGLGLCFIISSMGLKMPGDVHYITQLPVTIEPLEVILICCSSIVISLLATVLPSRMAVKLDPVDGLRCE
ncbi:MAG: ABC transporter permease [Proteobacteria bacterium]|nr:ABC transporter permease [Pseudomonadota bacterium]